MAAEPAIQSNESATIDVYVGAWTRGLARRWTAARAVAWGAGLALGPLLAVIVDHNWPGGLPRSAIRGAGIGWTAGVLLAAAALMLFARLRRVNPVFAGRQLEQALAIPHNAVVNALSLRRAPHETHALSAAARQASRELRGVTDLPSPPAGPRAALRLLVLAVIVAWLAYSIVAPKSVWQSLLRFFGAGLAPPTATRLALVRPVAGTVARAGDPLEIEFAVWGRQVDEVVLSIWDATHSVESRAVQLSAGAADSGPTHWSGLLAANEVDRDIAFVCRAGDAVLDGKIAVAPRPEITALHITLTPPAGLGETTTTTERDLTVWSGTLATFAVAASTPLREPVFVFRGESETRTRMQIESNAPASARTSVELRESGAYRIEFADRWNTPYRDGHLYSVIVRAPPDDETTITSPDAGAAGADPANENTEQGGDSPGHEPGKELDQPGERDEGDEGKGSSASGENGTTASDDPRCQGEPAASGDSDAPGNSGSATSQPDGPPSNGNEEPGDTRGDREGPSEGGDGIDGSMPADDGEAGDESGQPDGSSDGESGSKSNEPGAGDGRSGAGQPGSAAGTGQANGTQAGDPPPPEALPGDVNSPDRAGDDDAEPRTSGPTPEPGVGRAERSDVLARLARGETIPESALMDLGLSPEAARSFAGALRRAQADARRFGVSAAPRTTVQSGGFGDAAAQPGSALSAAAGRSATAIEGGLREALARIAPPPNQAVPPQLQAVLEAYYRSLAAQRDR